MRYCLPLLAIALLGGCKKNFYSVDEACHDTVPGAKKVEADEAVELLLRTNCYRRLVKLDRGHLDHRVQAGLEKHLAYMVEHRVWETGEAWNLEDPAKSGFSGVDVYERSEAADYLFEDVAGWGVWEIAYFGNPFTPWELVEYLMPDPFWRQMLLQPDWVDSAYAEAQEEGGLTIAHGTIFYIYPSIEREEFPVVYPKDGQTDAPWSYRSDTPDDSIYPLGDVGVPITITFSNSLASTSFDPYAVNPYNVQFESASLKSGGSKVPLELITPPGTGVGDLLRYTLVAVPLEPLQPDTEYTFEARVTWSEGQSKTLTSVFTTSPVLDFRTAVQTGVNARSAPEMHLRHRGPFLR